MAYYRFTRLQQYINGQPTDVYSKGERVDDVDYSTYDECMGGTADTRWVSMPQTVCYNGDLWSMEKEEISYDGGTTWSDTGNTRRASVIEPSASQCTGADNDWRPVPNEYVCDGTSKCIKEAEYINNSPTGRTRAGSIVELLSGDCGVMYQWVDVPDEYVCVYKCGRADKYTKQKQQYSIDGGLHWEDTGETREGNFIEKNSADCGCDTSITRWVAVSGEYVCVGTSKYTKEKEQTSTDAINWTDTGNTRAGSLIEQNSEDCGYTPRDYLTTEALGSGNISLNKGGTWDTLTNIKYSKNNGAWTAYTYGTNISVVAGDKIRWKGTEVHKVEEGNYNNFVATADYKIYGNPSSLLKDDRFVDETDAIHEYIYFNLFANSSTLKDASGLALPATTLAQSCYYQMFYNCTGLTSVPSNLLPATTLAVGCYDRMFYGCTSLTSAPELPATTLVGYCYFQMFRDCTSLVSAPSVLPATTLADYCYYYMFYNCASLTSAPELPATTLAEYCYDHMFYNCVSLTSVPALPATTLANTCYAGMFGGCTSLTSVPSGLLPATTLTQSCYYGMFGGCTSLTTAPELPATTLAVGCYVQMFRDCTSLNYIKCLATRISEAQNTDRWVLNVASSGTFVKASSMKSWPRNENGIPSGWTVQNA